MMIRQLTIPFVILLSAVLASCNKNSDEPSYATVYTDIVTYEGSSNGVTTFSFRKEGDSNLIKLTSTSTTVNIELTPGTRIMIQYAPDCGQRYMSSSITLLAATNIYGSGDAVEELSATETGNWRSDGVDMIAIYRSGDYVNVQFTGALGAQTAIVRLVADKETLDDEYPQLHLIYGPYSGLMTDTNMFNGSWNISSIWERSTCKGIKILYENNSSNIDGSVELVKDTTLTPGTF